MATDSIPKSDSEIPKNPDKVENGTTVENDSEPIDLEKKIVRQIEYYFGDFNLPKDKFMLEQIKVDDGWIPMSIMLKFQRLLKFTNDPKVVAKALLHSNLMEVDESGEEIKIRRSPEFPLPEFDESRRKEVLERSVYCARFPLDTDIDTLLNFFNSFGPIDNLIMRRYKDKLTKTFKFKGSVFVTFKTKDKGQEFLDLESVKYQDEELTRKWQTTYLAEKKQKILESKLKRSKKGDDEDKDKDEVEADCQKKESLPRGTVIRLKGDLCPLNRDDIKEEISSLGFEPAFVDVKQGESEAYVRLGEENAAKSFIEKNGTEIKVKTVNLTVSCLEGEEEDAFLEDAMAMRNAAFKRRQQLRRGKRKGRGNKVNKGGKKRKGSPTEDSPPSKKQVRNEN